MGLSPIPLTIIMGAVREESACSRQSLCEHSLSDKTTFSFACNSDRLHHPAIRVLKKNWIIKEAIQFFFIFWEIGNAVTFRGW